MRQLNSEELHDKFKGYVFDLELADFRDFQIKIDHFFYFLFDQNISKRILERISEDFIEIKSMLNFDVHGITPKERREIKTALVSREIQGAFAFFLIERKYNEKNKYSNHYIDLVNDWDYYKRGGNYHDFKNDFVTHFFKPFVELFEWYLYESKTMKNEDYFSFEDQSKIMIKIENLRESLERVEQKLEFSGQILDGHLEDLEKLVKTLNKKNLLEIIKGKFGDEILSKLISIEAFTKLIETISGEEFKLLN